MRHGVN